MPDHLLILLARVLGIAGVMLVAASAVLGVFLASRTAQRLRLLGSAPSASTGGSPSLGRNHRDDLGLREQLGAPIFAGSSG